MDLQKVLVFALMASTVCVALVSYLVATESALANLKPSPARRCVTPLVFVGCLAWVGGALMLVLSYGVVMRKPFLADAVRSAAGHWFSLTLLSIANLAFWLVSWLGARARRTRAKAYEQERVQR